MQLACLRLPGFIPQEQNHRSGAGVLVLCLSVCLTVTTVGPSLAETEFVTTLGGAFSVPPNLSPGMGNGVFVLDDAGIGITYTIEFSGLLGTEIAAHIHNAPPGQTGPTVLALPLNPGNPKTGIWQFVTPGIIAKLLAGNMYVNIHTTQFLDGEIRGDIRLSSSPVDVSTWGRIKALYR